MFTKPELNFLLICINNMPVPDTQSARNKAAMMLKVSDLLDAPPEQPKQPPQAPAKKKATHKK